MSTRFKFARRVGAGIVTFAAQAPELAGKTGLTFGRYFVANLWTLLPISLALMIVAAAIAVTRVPDGCQEKGVASINWFLCASETNRKVKVIPIDNFMSKRQVLTASGTLPDPVLQNVALVAKGDPSKSNSDITVAAREGTARVVWSVAFITLGLVAFTVIVASILFTCQGLIGHWRVMSGKVVDQPFDLELGWAAAGRAIRFLLLSLGILFIALLISLKLTALFIGDSSLSVMVLISSFNSHSSIFTDGIMDWLDRNIDHLQRLIIAGRDVLLTSVVLLAILVSSTLYQGPEDSALRLDGTSSALQGATYLRYLGRSFRRLKLAIYLGAALLVALTAEISAQYNWALSYLTVDSANPLAKSLNAFAQQVTTSIGLGFTLALAALYFPAVVLIRERARDYYRARHPNDSLQQQDAFLSDQRLMVTLPTSYSDFLALLAPLATASVSKLFSVLGQQ